MIPEVQHTTPTQRGTTRRGKQQTGEARPGLRYITNADLSRDKTLVKILDVRVEQKREGQENYSDITLKVLFRNTERLLGLKFNDEYVFATLRNSFGADEEDWKGKEFSLYLEEASFDHKLWRRCEVVNAKKGGRN